MFKKFNNASAGVQLVGYTILALFLASLTVAAIGFTFWEANAHPSTTTTNAPVAEGHLDTDTVIQQVEGSRWHTSSKSYVMLEDAAGNPISYDGSLVRVKVPLDDQSSELVRVWETTDGSTRDRFTLREQTTTTPHPESMEGLALLSFFVGIVLFMGSGVAAIGAVAAGAEWSQQRRTAAERRRRHRQLRTMLPS